MVENSVSDKKFNIARATHKIVPMISSIFVLNNAVALITINLIWSYNVTQNGYQNTDYQKKMNASYSVDWKRHHHTLNLQIELLMEHHVHTIHLINASTVFVFRLDVTMNFTQQPRWICVACVKAKMRLVRVIMEI